MTPENQAKYAELSGILEINLLKIDQEVAVTAHRLQEAAELAVAAGNEERASRMARDIITAEAGQRLRGTPADSGKARSETQIERELILEPDVQAAREAHENAQASASLCRSLAENLKEKARLVGKACDMTIAGYITPSSYSPKRRELMRPSSLWKSSLTQVVASSSSCLSPTWWGGPLASA